MAIKQSNRKTALIQIVIALVVGGSLTALANSSKGKELHADVWLLTILLFLSFGLYTYFLITKWKSLSKKQRVALVCGTLLTSWATLSSISLHWPDLPWGQRGAIETANRFMANLQEADYASAYEKLSPVTQDSLTPDSLQQPNAQPVSWSLQNIDRDSKVFGTATFLDGVELPVEIRMRWLHYQWKIYGVQFGEWKQDVNGDFEITTRMDFMICCDSYGFLFDKFMSLFDQNEPLGWNQSR